jgi:hypothetical protein
MTGIKSITQDEEQFLVDFEDVVWGQPEAVVINKPSHTIRIIFKKKEGGHQKVEGCNFDEIVSFHVERLGTHKEIHPGYLTIVLETTAGQMYKIVPEAGTTYKQLKDDVVSDLFSKMDAYLPARRQLPAMSRRLVTHPEGKDGLSIARIKTRPTWIAVGIFLLCIGGAVGAIVVSFVLVVWRVGFVLVVSLLLYVGILPTEVTTIIIDPEKGQLLMARCWAWCIRRRSKPVPFSDIAVFDLSVVNQECRVVIRRKGQLPVVVQETVRDSSEARALVGWLQEHVPTPST